MDITKCNFRAGTNVVEMWLLFQALAAGVDETFNYSMLHRDKEDRTYCDDDQVIDHMLVRDWAGTKAHLIMSYLQYTAGRVRTGFV